MKIFLITITCFLYLPTEIQGQTRYKDPIFKENEIEVLKDSIYARIDANSYVVSYLKDQQWVLQLSDNLPVVRAFLSRLYKDELRVDIYQPKNDVKQDRPLIIFIHGGGFILGTKMDASIVHLCEDFAKKGYVTASINYRLMALGYPSLLKAGYMAAQDGKAAVRYFKSNASTYGIDPDFVYVGGISAGAITALNVAYLDTGEDMAGRQMKFDDFLGCPDCVGQHFDYNSSVKGVFNISGGIIGTDILDNDIPTLSFHGEVDEVVNTHLELPFKKNMSRYNSVIEKLRQFAVGIGSFLNLSVPSSTIDSAKMEKMSGSVLIHEELLSRGTDSFLKVFPEYDHNLILSEVGPPRASADEIKQIITAFLYNNLPLSKKR